MAIRLSIVDRPTGAVVAELPPFSRTMGSVVGLRRALCAPGKVIGRSNRAREVDTTLNVMQVVDGSLRRAAHTSDPNCSTFGHVGFERNIPAMSQNWIDKAVT